MRKHCRAILAMATFGLVSCSLDEPLADTLLSVTIGLSAETLARGSAVTITMHAQNVGNVPVTLTAPSDCLLFFQVNAIGGQLAYRSLDDCAGEPATRTIQPDEEFSMTRDWDGRSTDGTRVIGGTYLVRAGAALPNNAVLGLGRTLNVE